MAGDRADRKRGSGLVLGGALRVNDGALFDLAKQRAHEGDLIIRDRAVAHELGDDVDDLVPDGHGWVWNQTLMDLGALRCTPDANDCALVTHARWASKTTGAGLAVVELNLP